jgi:feruloyl esterase
MRVIGWALLGLLLVGGVAGEGLAARKEGDACAALVGFRDARLRLEVTAAEQVPAAAPGTVRAQPYLPPLSVGLPAYCKVSGRIDDRTGAGGRRFGIGFELALPDVWNGRFLFQGGGGLNGSIAPPLGTTGAGDVPALARGFAVVSTDSGHTGEGFDASFMQDQRAALDFAHASVGTTTQAALLLVQRHYGKPPEHSYMAGCSTGGRETMLATQRWPELFDGALVAAPAMRTGFSNLALANARARFAEAAPRDADGKPQLARTFSTADRALILRELLAQCDDLDGLADGVIENVLACRFQPARLQCAPGKHESCLGAAQVTALTGAFKAPHDAAGAPLYVDYPYDTGIVSEGPGIPGFLPAAGPDILAAVMPQAAGFDVDAQARKVRADAVQMLTDTSTWTNLGTFLGRGGKVIYFHGVSDPWFSAHDTLDYFKRAEAANGAQAWADASRFYFVPGMGHCGGGTTRDSFDLLGPLVAWVEQGQAPGQVLARGAALPGQRPLCPYPTHAHYTGGDVAAPESYTCEAAPATP